MLAVWRWRRSSCLGYTRRAFLHEAVQALADGHTADQEHCSRALFGSQILRLPLQPKTISHQLLESFSTISKRQGFLVYVYSQDAMIGSTVADKCPGFFFWFMWWCVLCPRLEQHSKKLDIERRRLALIDEAERQAMQVKGML